MSRENSLLIDLLPLLPKQNGIQSHQLFSAFQQYGGWKLPSLACLHVQFNRTAPPHQGPFRVMRRPPRLQWPPASHYVCNSVCLLCQYQYATDTQLNSASIMSCVTSSTAALWCVSTLASGSISCAVQYMSVENAGSWIWLEWLCNKLTRSFILFLLYGHSMVHTATANQIVKQCVHTKTVCSMWEKWQIREKFPNNLMFSKGLYSSHTANKLNATTLTVTKAYRQRIIWSGFPKTQH